MLMQYVDRPGGELVRWGLSQQRIGDCAEACMSNAG